MIHPYDSAVQMPNMDLYDTNMMQLYINAVLREYERGLLDLKEFLSKYGDFFSPFAKDVQNWDMNVMGPVMDMVDAFYKQGIDPARNPEARAMLLALMRRIPYGEAAKMRYNAKMGEEYLKNRGIMASKGLYNPDRELFALQQAGLTPFEQWDSSKGMWTRTSPSQYKSLFDITDPWFEHIKDYEMTPEELKNEFNIVADPRKKYTGVGRNKLMETTNDRIPGWLGSEDAAYYKYVAKRELLQLGIANPTEELVYKLLKEDIVNANAQRIHRPTTSADEYAMKDYEHALAKDLDDYRTNNDIRAYAAKAAMSGSSGGDSGSVGGSGSGSGAGGGSGVSAINFLGPIDQLNSDYNENMKNNLVEHANLHNKEKNRAWNDLVSAYNKLSPEEKRDAVEYGKLWRIVNDPNKSVDIRKNAKLKYDQLELKYSSISPKNYNMLNWWKAFTNRMKIENTNVYQTFVDENTTDGILRTKGETTQKESQLRTNSYNIWEKNNVRNKSLNGTDRTAINSILGYIQSGAQLVGKMTGNRDVKDLVVADATGTRTYRYASIPRTVSRIIRGKNYSVDVNGIAGREYAVAFIKNKENLVISENAIFDDPSVVEALLKLNLDLLAKYGIKAKHAENDDKEIVAYEIPISSKYGHGQGMASANIEGIKNKLGVLFASNYAHDKQAYEITKQVQGR